MGKSSIDSSSVTTVGLDLAKHVFQVHCADASGLTPRSGGALHCSPPKCFVKQKRVLAHPENPNLKD
jgi:hypothetical protein